MSTTKLIELKTEILTNDHLKEQRRQRRVRKEREKRSRDDESERQTRLQQTPNIDLEQGKNLPEYLKSDVDDDVKCKPLKDIDTFYEEKETYTILDESYAIYRFSTTKSLFLLGPLNPVRKVANRIFVHSFFNSIIMFTILVNCVVMTMNPSKGSFVEKYLENIFLGIYTFEMIIKVLSRGFFYPHFTYLRDPWNILDISVIFTAYLDIVIQTISGSSDGAAIPGMAALRAFRVLRALKAISAIPGLKAIVSALIESVKALKDVMILTLFCLSVFALIGLQLFMGSLRNKCVLVYPPDVNLKYIGVNNSVIQFPFTEDFKDSHFAFMPENKSLPLQAYTTFLNNSNYEKASDIDRIVDDNPGSLVSLNLTCERGEECGAESFWTNQTKDEWDNDPCNFCYFQGAPLLCGFSSGSGGCQDGFVCKKTGDNPNFGYTSFDTFLSALLSLFRLLAQDYWENLYMLTLRANGQVYVIFFMLVIFLGSFYLINLILAVVAMAYEEQHQIVEAEEERKQELMREKKAQLEALVDEIDNEQRRQERSLLEINGRVTGGKESRTSSPRPASIISKGGRRGTNASNRSSSKPHIEIPVNNDDTKSSIYESDPGDIEAAIGGNTAKINESLTKPFIALHKNKGRSPIGSFKGSFKSITQSRVHNNESDVEEKGSLQSLIAEKNTDLGYKTDFVDIYDLNTNEVRQNSNREDIIHRSKKNLTVENRGSMIRHSPIDIQPLRNRSSAADSDRQMDWLRPNYQGSRHSLAVENMTEPQLEKLKQRAMSQADVMSEGIQQDFTQNNWYQILKKIGIWDCWPFWTHIQKFMKTIADDCFFDLSITLCIVLNTVFLAMEKEPAGQSYKDMLEMSNQIFSFIFLGELVIKLIGMHPFYYFQEAWNIFDFIIVFVSLLEMGLQGVSGLSVLRSFRLMRVFKLAKSWPTLNMLIKIIGNSMGSLGNLTLILLILLFIFAVVGMQLFRDAYHEFIQNQQANDEPRLRWHMDDFFHSFLIVFRILCGEWIETMWDCMRIVEKKSKTMKSICIPVFLLVQIVGNLVVLNLFLALLLSSFTGENLEPDENEPPNSIQLSMMRIKKFRKGVLDYIADKRTTLLKCIGSRQHNTRKNGGSKKTGELILKNSPQSEVTLANNCDPTISLGEFASGYIKQENNSNSDNIVSSLVGYEKKEIELNSVLPNNVDDIIHVPIATEESDFAGDASESDSENQSLHHSRSICGSVSSTSSTESMSNSEYIRKQEIDLKQQQAQENENVDEPAACWPAGFSAKLKCLDPPIETPLMQMWWNARKISYRIIEHPWFEMFIILMIMLSSAALAFEDVYFNHKPGLKKVLKYADRIFTYVFILEMFLKWLGYGMKKYFTNAWCGLDFMIVAVSIVGLVTDALGMGEVSGIRSLRTLRAMRPLRALSRFQGMKVVVNALIGAIPSIFNVLMVCLIFWLIFSIMGVNLFAGKFWKCMNITSGYVFNATNVTMNLTMTNGTIVYREYPKINEEVCRNISELDDEILWRNSKLTFDNAFSGYLSLLQIATFKGWTNIMYDAVDHTSLGEQPQYEFNLYYYIYFVAFIVFGSFCTLNLFIGVIIDNFNQQKKKLGGQDIFMTEEQRKYYNAMKKLGSKKPQKPVPRPKNKCQAWVFDIVTHQIFEITIMLLIIANMVTMMIEHEGQTQKLTDILAYINYVFVAVFTGEAVIKLFALRHHYFTNPWNVFDFIVVILSIFGSAFGSLIQKYFVQPTLFRIIRLARIGRILRLIKGAKGIRTLLFALMMSLPALVNIGLLLILVMFIYSIFGMSQFSYVKRYSGVDDMYNFETFTNSFICLFMITTSAGWAELLNPLLLSDEVDCERDLLNGNPTGNGNCGSPSLGIAFFVTYLIFTFLIVVNMYIAIILENFGVATEESTDPLGEEDFEMFYEVWERFDPKATQFIAYSQLSDMVDSLHPPLRVQKPNNRQLVAMDLPMVIGDRLHCLDILFALTKRVLGESDELEGLRSQMEEKFMASNPSKVSYEPITTTLWRKQEEMSAVMIQRWWRSFKFRRTIYAASDMALKEAAATELVLNEAASNGITNYSKEMNGQSFALNNTNTTSATDKNYGNGSATNGEDFKTSLSSLNENNSKL